MACEVDDATKILMRDFGRWLLQRARIGSWHETYAREMWDEWQRTELLAGADVFDDEPEGTKENHVTDHA